MRHSANAGFSVIELLIAMLIMAIVTVQVLGIFSSQLQSYVGQRAILDVQGDARLAADLMFYEVRMAGYMMPREAAVASADGGSSGSDLFCVSDPSVLNATQVDLATSPFDGASLSSNLGASSGSVSLVADDLDVDGDGDNDFTENSGIIVAGGTSSHCARITNITGGTVTFTPSTPGTFAANLPDARAVPAVIYAVTSSGLTRNGLAVSWQVEDLQAEFGVDVNDDGILSGGEFPIHDLNGQNPALVREVRLSVLTRTTSENQKISGPGRQAVANRDAAGSDDAYLRRLVTITGAPRNLL